MFYWNYKHHYRLWNEDERFCILCEIAPHWFPPFLKCINFVLNIIVPLYLYMQLQLSWLQLGIAFIVFDLALILFEQFILLTIPYAIANLPSKAIAEWQYYGLKRRLERAKDKMDLIRKTECEECSYYSHRRATCLSCKQVRRLFVFTEALEASIEAAEARVSSFSKSTKTNTPAPTTTPVEPVKASQPDRSLAQYFNNISERCQTLINEHRFDFLIPIRKSCDSLVYILQKNPAGDSCVTGELCRKLDLHMEFCETISEMSPDARVQYMNDAKTVTRTLHDQMQQCAINANKAQSVKKSPEDILAQILSEKETTNA